MKALKTALALLLICVLSGCDSVSFTTNGLMNPPKLTIEQTKIADAIGNNYQLRYPLEGESGTRTPIVFQNIDSDPAKEAIAFYCPTSDNAGTQIAILDEVNGKWKNVANFTGDGNEIDSIAFGDINNDGISDLIVAWTSFNTTNLTLCVYSYVDGKYEKVYTNNSSFNEMKVADLNNDGVQDVLLIKLDRDISASAKLISYKDGKIEEVSDAPLDSTVSNYAGLYNTKIDEKTNAVLIDGRKGDHNMVTELVYCNAKGELVTPYYDKIKGTSIVSRNVAVDCQDIDGDSIVEIPDPVELPDYENVDYSQKLWLIRWKTIDAQYPSKLDLKFSSVVNSAMKYYFVIPEDWVNRITVVSNGDGSKWTFKLWNDKTKTVIGDLFYIQAYSQSPSQVPVLDSTMFQLGKSDSVIYEAGIDQDLINKYPDLNITIKGITNNFKLMDK
jgi:hypothetical protein